jgi:hypothetical protein
METEETSLQCLSNTDIIVCFPEQWEASDVTFDINNNV